MNDTEKPTPNAADHQPFSAAWYRKRAAEVRFNGKTVSQYNHFLAIADAIERTELVAQSDASDSPPHLPTFACEPSHLPTFPLGQRPKPEAK